MKLRERSIVFDGVDLCEAYGLHYSKFSEDLPQKKLITVSIPYGSDVDITDRLGKGGWTNGKHHLTFLLYGSTEEERLAAKTAMITQVHGTYADYKLTWDDAYTYSGRATVAVEHRSEHVDVVTIDIDRFPWKRAVVEEVISLVDGMGPGTSPREQHYYFNKYKRYYDVRVTALTDVKGKWYTQDYNSWVHYGLNGATRELLAEDVWMGRDYRDSYTFMLNSRDDFLMFVDEDARNLVVNSNKITYSGNDANIGSSYVINDGDMYFADYKKQFITLNYEGWDM